jgi:hypothetical protein
VEDFRIVALTIMRSKKEQEFRQALFAIKGSKVERCFWPTEQCQRPAVRAHSVQNATALGLLEEEGHVIAPTIRLDARRGPIIDLNRVGRNRATTFAGLCAKHDREAFSPIEVGQLDLEDPVHRFLLAFRATFYEVHATAAAGIQTQAAYLKRIELGLDQKGDLSPAGVFATQRLIIAWQTWAYMSHFADAYFARAFDFVEHDLRIMTVERPTLAASALFAFPSRKHEDGVRVCLTVLPITESQTAVLLSYVSDEARKTRKQLKKLLRADGDNLKRELTRRLLNHCANFVLSPSYVNAWSATKREVIVGLFIRTVFQNDLGFEHPELNLFL